ncbi:hypothetical protein [Gordonia jinghuaiqii]|uniref:hypothetical protein n=1 Tax=Gordonia jinghuaiqii TaxID=2758710 RepID=UPI001CB7921E|nr:hypothetical protein [Gordonia jinghuaiqii]
MTLGAGIDSTGSADPVDESVEPTWRPDEEMSSNELTEVLVHCAGLTASATYRMMMAASLKHDELASDYAERRAETHTGELVPSTPSTLSPPASPPATTPTNSSDPTASNKPSPKSAPR